ncbi:MAG: CRISPR-associated endoribonuclease Cas6 [Aquificaceae bacterium]|nr:CRISPR-associated endoribonuclease Cas6 [Aquificaceae bacterium]MCX8076187.1 CRISPR-associated endoribonuclease Cas6 [Aquificaceae bacterium]MDW8433442.1 CRISPR-associated endoribonuclease Cas6 [Aquificaceae bacterium]
MRLSCRIKLRRGVEIPKWFRQGLLYLIKESLIKSGEDGELFYRRWYSFNRSKPFTFSAFFPLRKEGNKNVLDGDYFRFLFSTNDEEFLIRVYSGLNALSSTGFKCFGYNAKIESFNLIPERKFTSNRAKFKTLSPFILRNPKNGDYYLYPVSELSKSKVSPNKFKYWIGVDEDEFNQRLRENLVRITGREAWLLSIKLIDIVPVLCGSKNTSHKFIATYPGIKAYLELQARPEVLKILYDVGIGARRSEGFGMLEVVEG